MDGRKRNLSSTQLTCTVSVPPELLLKLKKFYELIIMCNDSSWIIRFLCNTKTTKVISSVSLTNQLRWLLICKDKKYEWGIKKGSNPCKHNTNPTELFSWGKPYLYSATKWQRSTQQWCCDLTLQPG